jgi:hypothetical protein
MVFVSSFRYLVSATSFLSGIENLTVQVWELKRKGKVRIRKRGEKKKKNEMKENKQEKYEERIKEEE